MAKSLEVAAKPGDIVTIKAKITAVYFSEDRVSYDVVCVDKDDIPYDIVKMYGVKEDFILSVKND